MSIAFSNNAAGLLSAPIGTGDVSLTLQSGGPFFPTLGTGDYFYGTLEEGANYEIVKVTAMSGNNVTTMIRAQDGTTALAFTTAASFSVRIPRQALLETTPEGSEFHWMMMG